jgi:transposase
MLRARIQGQTDPGQLAALAAPRPAARPEQLRDALNGRLQPLHRKLLALFPDRLALLEAQMGELEQLAAEELKGHAEAVVRLAELPGLGVNSAQQIIAEVGPQAAVFESAGELASWVGVGPGRQESAGQSRSNHSPEGNPPMRRLLNQAAHAAVKEDGSYLQAVFGHWLPTLGYNKVIWAIAHKICRLIWKVLHDGLPLLGARTDY